MAIWGLVIVVVSILVIAQPDRHTVTHVYRKASHAWETRAALYHTTSAHGYQYLPAAAMLYIPIASLPLPFGEVLWRWICIGLFTSALWRLGSVLGGHGGTSHFFLLTLLCVPSALSSARDGQFNLPLASLLLHGAIDLGRQRWNRAAISLSLAFALKTVALPMLLLAAVLYRPMRVRAAVSSLGALAAPFLFANPAYVWKQYELYWKKLRVVSDPNEHFSNLHGLLSTLGFHATGIFFFAAAVGAGLLTLILALYARRKVSALNGAIATFALCAIYLMLFNPKTETNSYVILSPAIAAFAVRSSLTDGSYRESRLLSVLALCLGVENYGKTLFYATDFWLKPLIALLFCAYLLVDSIRRVRPGLEVKRKIENPTHQPEIGASGLKRRGFIKECRRRKVCRQ